MSHNKHILPPLQNITFGTYPNTINLNTFVALGRVKLALFWDGARE